MNTIAHTWFQMTIRILPDGPESVQEDAVADEPVDPVVPAIPAGPVMPVLAPKCNTEGHRKICEVLLPRLFEVLTDAVWCTRSPRDQVREACDSYLAN